MTVTILVTYLPTTIVLVPNKNFIPKKIEKDNELNVIIGEHFCGLYVNIIMVSWTAATTIYRIIPDETRPSE